MCSSEGLLRADISFLSSVNEPIQLSDVQDNASIKKIASGDIHDAALGSSCTVVAASNALCAIADEYMTD